MDFNFGFMFGGGSGGGPLVSATVEDAAKSNIVLTFNGTVTATTAALDWTYSVNGGADTSPTAVISGSTLTLTMSAPIVYGDTVTVTYADATSDMAIGGVQLEAITDRNVTNNVAAVAGASIIFFSKDNYATIPEVILQANDTATLTFNTMQYGTMTFMHGSTTAVWVYVEEARIKYDDTQISMKIDTVPIGDNALMGTYLTDGLDHVMEITAITPAGLSAIAGKTGDDSHFTGVIKDFSYTISGVTTSWAMDTATSTTEDSTPTGTTLTYVRTVADDWFSSTLLATPIYSNAFNPPDGEVGTAYTTYDASGVWTGGTPYIYMLNSFLPNGLVLDKYTGIISGTPSMDFNFQYISITAMNTSGYIDCLWADINITLPTGMPVAVLDAYNVTDGTPLVATGTDSVLNNDTYV